MSLGLIVMTLAFLDDLVLAVEGEPRCTGAPEEAQLEAERPPPGGRRPPGSVRGNMDPNHDGGYFVVALFALLGVGIWVSVSLIGVGMIAMALFSNSPVGRVLATTVWGGSTSWTLTALPCSI